MAVSSPSAVARLSTGDVPATQKLDYWVSVLSDTMTPVYVRGADKHSFHSGLCAASLGPVTIVSQDGSPHECGRGRSEISRSTRHGFNLVMGRDCRFGARHRREMQMAPGDLALIDSEYEVDFTIGTNYQIVNLDLDAEWVRTWIADPAALIGQRIPGDSPWGKALGSFVALLDPQAALSSPLSPVLLTDHLGAMLSMAASQQTGAPQRLMPAERSLSDRARDLLAQRCQEPSLEAYDVALSLGVSVRTLHRALGQSGLSFGALLIEARAKCARRMLDAPIFKRLTLAEIGRRAGFVDPSHFTRVIRRIYGVTPQQIRARGGASLPPESETDSDT